MGEFHRVAGQVGEDLAQAARVARKQGGHLGVSGAEQLQPFVVGLERHGRGKVVQQTLQVEVQGLQVELARLDLGKVENVVDQPEK